MRSRLAWLGIALVAAMVVAFYFWTSTSIGGRAAFGRRTSDYYNLQIRGFLDGHMYMQVALDPELRVELPNRVVASSKPFLLDASFYQGKYFLYFGVTPAVTLFLPWTLLTGHDFPEWAAAPLLASLAFLIAVAWLMLMRKRFFSRATGVAWLGIVAAAGLANGVPVVLRRPLFYEVAVMGAWLWSVAGLFCLTQAVTLTSKRLRWLVVASGCAGMAAGCRPTMVIGGGLALVLAAAWVVWRRASRRKYDLPQIFAAALVPMGCSGIGLAWYNWARFGNPLEFGLTYQLGSNPNGFAFKVGSLWRSLWLYYCNPPDVGWFFPFVAPGAKPIGYNPEQVHGQFWFLPFLGFTVAVLVWELRRRRAGGALFAIAAIAFASALASMIFVSMAPGQSNRYMVDFHPLLVLAALLGALAVVHAGRRLLTVVSTVWLAALIFLNAGASVHVHRFFLEGNWQGFERLGRWCDETVWLVFRLTRPVMGAVEFQVSFPRGVAGRVEPLVVAGAGNEVDSIQVHYLDESHARLLFDHQDFGGREGAVFELRPGESRRIHVQLGTLCPSVWHPWYRTLPAGASRLAFHIRATIDGDEVLALDAPCYRASPNQVKIGEKGGLLVGEENFTGTIESVVRRGPDLDWLKKELAATGAVRVRARLPQDRYGQQEPLLLTGVAERFDLVCVRYIDAQTISIGVQHAGWPELKFSPPLKVDYDATHEFEISLGSLAPGAWWLQDQADAWRARGATIRLDGRTVLSERFISHPAELWEKYVGCTPFPVTTSRRLYGGPMEILPRVGGSEASFAAALAAGRPIRLKLRFPPQRFGIAEPLLTSGVTGAGDGLYVRYVDPRHVVFGFDHWGVGGTTSKPVEVDYEAEQEITIGFGALLPAGESGRGRLSLTCNGASALDLAQDYHVTTALQTRIGVNHIGLSTSEAVFTGEILEVGTR